MKKHIWALAGIWAAGCLTGVIMPTEEPVVDGLSQSSQFLYMQKEEAPAPLEWSAEHSAWLPQETAAFVPVQGIPIDVERAQQSKAMVAALREDIQGALQRYNPDCRYAMEDAYVASVAESADKPGLYRVVIHIDTADSIERLVFDVAQEAPAELVRYSRMRV